MNKWLSDENFDSHQLAQQMHQLMIDLFPICRSITGNGVRETLSRIKSFIPLKVNEVASGTHVFDWTIPREWNIRDAYIKNSNGEKIVDFKNSNLHVLNYSIPVNKQVTLQELKEHLFTIPEHPDWIPYRTSYYNENWGFCIAYNQYKQLSDDVYTVTIDSTLEKGHLTYGEYFIPGETGDEILISTHVCHPSLCNDNLSGIALSTFLAKYLSKQKNRYSYRFLFIPGTIGSITWLALNEEKAESIKHGLVVVCVGDSGTFTYKKTRQGVSEIDQAAITYIRNEKKDANIVEFFPYGYDERQYCSPGFNLPVGCLMRTPHGQFPEYHTSADNLDFVKPANLVESLLTYMGILDILENNFIYINQNPKCEPQLGKRGLYQKIGGHEKSKEFQLAMLWVLNLSDGSHSLLEIADRSSLSFNIINDAATVLYKNKLLQKKL